jgi:hypothetical protein
MTEQEKSTMTGRGSDRTKVEKSLNSFFTHFVGEKELLCMSNLLGFVLYSEGFRGRTPLAILSAYRSLETTFFFEKPKSTLVLFVPRPIQGSKITFEVIL